MGGRDAGCSCAAWQEILNVGGSFRVNTEAGDVEPSEPLTFTGNDENFLFFTRANGDPIAFCCVKITSIETES
ncbi:hypothetical protein [Marinicrinis sediminis]|uniref:Uncharacterized protein n=1 Tax=Marinicrinis sediminis TaxID=1652465 RepID=A0ABW5R8P4_9BACL